MFTLKIKKATLLIGKETEMVTQRKKATGREPVKQLKVKKETLRDLDAKNKSREVKGGSGSPYCTIPTRAREG